MSARQTAPLTAQITARLRAAGCVRAEAEAALLVAEAGARTADLDELVRRREAGEPLERVLGWAELGGLRVSVAPGVFVPRHRSTLLAAEAAALARAVPGRPVVLDLCCGTGILGALVADALRPDGLELVAADVDPAAVACARENLRPWGAEVYEGDLFAPLPRTLRGRVDVLVANVPYVPTARIASLPPEARDHEARSALDGGPDGLDLLRRVAAEAPSWLAPGGHLLVEVSTGQADDAADVLVAAGLAHRLVRDEDAVVVVGAVRRG